MASLPWLIMRHWVEQTYFGILLNSPHNLWRTMQQNQIFWVHLPNTTKRANLCLKATLNAFASVVIIKPLTLVCDRFRSDCSTWLSIRCATYSRETLKHSKTRLGNVYNYSVLYQPHAWRYSLATSCLADMPQGTIATSGPKCSMLMLSHYSKKKAFSIKR